MFLPEPSRFRALARLTAPAVAVLTLSCLGDGSGPNLGVPGQMHLVPFFQSAAPSGIVPIDRIRVLLFRSGVETPALDTVVQLTAGDTLADLSLNVAVFTAADSFTAMLALITPAGDTAFRGGPLSVVATSSVSAPPAPTPIAVPLTYVGTGAGADSVVITVQPPGVLTGDTAVFQAVAYDDGAPVPGTPIGWRSLDSLRATVPQPAVGRVVGGAQRGAARIVAQLLTGPADTASLDVQPLPAAIGLVSGNNQTAQVRALLGAPLVSEVRAGDGGVVSGVWVRFSVLSGGGTPSADSALTDALGRTSVQWTLGPAAGTQQLRASSAKAPGVQY
ncbi:MAG TPA: hypothetical protein VD793_05400, partial [Gemmatimonadales bacterium]|nr:hypothetical protein [Gemmatimonadales bacterium]